jgi:two-component system, LytTR family, response regulator LytT
MKKRKILIAEDVHNVSVDIRHTLEGMGFEIQKIVGTGEEALAVVEAEAPDLVLIDTVLNGELSGIEAATMILDLYGIPVVFLTGPVQADQVRDVVASEAFGMVVKPFRPETLEAAIGLALNKVKPARKTVARNSGSMFVRADYRHNRIDFDKILYIEALKDYVLIHLLSGQVTTHTTIKGIEQLLPENDFVRIHRSYIVRIDKIHSIKYPELIMEGKMKVLPIGGLYKKNLFDRLNSLQ